jgi:hypothetical protein
LTPVQGMRKHDRRNKNRETKIPLIANPHHRSLSISSSVAIAKASSPHLKLD